MSIARRDTSHCCNWFCRGSKIWRSKKRNRNIKSTIAVVDCYRCCHCSGPYHFVDRPQWCSTGVYIQLASSMSVFRLDPLLSATFRPAHGCWSGRHWCTRWLESVCLSIVYMVFVYWSSPNHPFLSMCKTNSISVTQILDFTTHKQEFTTGEVLGDLLRQKLLHHIILYGLVTVSLRSFKINPTK